jgi:hypothetical protein
MFSIFMTYSPYSYKTADSHRYTFVSTGKIVVHITRDFTTRFPAVEIFFIGSTEERTKLYARILKMYHREFKKEFKISGLIQKLNSYTAVPFEANDAFDYFAFLIRKIE